MKLIIVYFLNMETGEQDAVYIYDAFDRMQALRMARQAVIGLQWKIITTKEVEA